MLQGLQPPDHGFDARAHLLILVHERGSLTRKGFVAGAQRPVLLAQMLDRCEELIDALAETRELEIQLCFCSVAHAKTIEPRSRRGQSRPAIIMSSFVMIAPDYHHIEQLLRQERSLAEPAEAHGTLAGCL